MKGICYWCGKPAVSMEHVPPKCIFPEEKDIRGIYEGIFRKNLIKVVHHQKMYLIFMLKCDRGL